MVCHVIILIPFFVDSLGEEGQKFTWCTTSIYIIDHVNFWLPSSRGATKKIEIKCVFLLTQTVDTLQLTTGKGKKLSGLVFCWVIQK